MRVIYGWRSESRPSRLLKNTKRRTLIGGSGTGDFSQNDLLQPLSLLSLHRQKFHAEEVPSHPTDEGAGKYHRRLPILDIDAKVQSRADRRRTRAGYLGAGLRDFSHNALNPVDMRRAFETISHSVRQRRTFCIAPIQRIRHFEMGRRRGLRFHYSPPSRFSAFPSTPLNSGISVSALMGF